MDSSSDHEREVRAARNQSLFRSLNEKMGELNKTFESMTETFAIACECADTNCIDMINIRPDDYFAVRSVPRHFVVRAGHVYPDVEVVVRESDDDYVVVEKIGAAGEVAEVLEADTAGH